jgi:multidrug resistance efflux pump
MESSEIVRIMQQVMSEIELDELPPSLHGLLGGLDPKSALSKAATNMYSVASSAGSTDFNFAQIASLLEESFS